MASCIRRTILLVEDEHTTRLMETKMLERNGYAVITAVSGEEAVEIVSKSPEIDLILMDIDLGEGIDGTEAAEIIITEHDIPLVFLSSHTEPEIVEKTEGITSYGYVVKNTAETVLMASIKMAFRLHEAHLANRAQNMELESVNENLNAALEGLEYSYAKLIRSKEETFKREKALRESEASVRNKLKTILEPEGDIGGLSLADIIDTDALQKIMDNIFSLTRMGGALLDMSGKVLVSAGWQDVCMNFHRRHPESRKNCEESDRVLSRGVTPGTFKTYRCKNNMWDIVTPVIVGGKQLGNFFIGQFFYEDEVPDQELFREQARRYGFDENEYLTALEMVPRRNRLTVNALMSLYSQIIFIISTLSMSSINFSRILAVREHTEVELKQREYILNKIFDLLPIGLWYADKNGKLLRGNPEGVKIWGAEPKVPIEEYGVFKARRLPSGEEIPPEEWALAKTVLEGVTIKDEMLEIDAFDGRKKIILNYTSPVTDDSGQMLGAIIMNKEITDRWNNEQRINALLKEKELLLKETHHRVKNNMNTIYGLLTLQAESLDDRLCRDILNDAAGRIESMAVLYDKLYRSEHHHELNVSDFVPALVGEVINLFAGADRIIKDIKTDDFMLSAKLLSSIGIILNELITNSMKHAFVSNENPQITLSVSKNGNLVSILYSDNGPGLPESVSIEESSTFGLQLISILVKQIKGKLTAGKGGGAEYLIEFYA